MGKCCKKIASKAVKNMGQKAAKNISEQTAKHASIAAASLLAAKKAADGSFLKNVNTITNSIQQIRSICSSRKDSIAALKNKNKEAIKKERKRGQRNMVIAGIVGITAGCAAGYALSKAYDITKSDMVYSNGSEGENFEDAKSETPIEVEAPEAPIAGKKFISVGESAIMSVDGSTTVIHPNHAKETTEEEVEAATKEIK